MPAKHRVAAADVQRAHRPAGRSARSKSAAKALAPRPLSKVGQALFADLRARLLEISDLNRANAVLGWDQSTYMPSGGGAARGRQQALLGRLSHERFTDKAVGCLLDRLAPIAADLEPDTDDACLVRVVRRQYDRAIRVPASFVERDGKHSARCYQIWQTARPAGDFAAVRDGLEMWLDLSREWAGYMSKGSGPQAHIADPFMDVSDEGMTVATVRALFNELRKDLVPLVRAITNRAPGDDTCLRLHFPEDAQLVFSLKAAERIGYDLSRGRLDKTAHPFMTRFAAGDVRITTRVNENDLGDAFFSTLHEAGHALYELGVAPELDGTSLGRGVSSGVHESQSRLWENLVGRSRAYWEHSFSLLQEMFPKQLGNVPLDTFYRAINKVQRSLIRTDADEVTYNLHVMIRFDLELALLEGTLPVKDLPRAWAERYEADLGVVPPDDRDGVLQDVHWYAGGIGGAFQGYTIGNILSAQFYTAASQANPGLEAQIASGDTSRLHAWLKDNVYRHGAKFPPADLVRRATGAEMTIKPYMAYLQSKYGALYAL